MHFKQTSLYIAGIAVAAFAAFTAIVPPSGVHNDFEATTPPFMSGTELPAMLNSRDTTCGAERQCSDYEFNDMVSDLQRQWAITPQWVRSQCNGNSTVPSMEQCIVTQTRAWMRENSYRQAPWVRMDTLGAVAKYAGK